MPFCRLHLRRGRGRQGAICLRGRVVGRSAGACKVHDIQRSIGTRAREGLRISSCPLPASHSRYPGKQLISSQEVQYSVGFDAHDRGGSESEFDESLVATDRVNRYQGRFDSLISWPASPSQCSGLDDRDKRQFRLPYPVSPREQNTRPVCL